MLLTTLPIDLIYDILLMLEDRKTLAAFVSSNKYLNQAFKTHPNAALRQVVCNEIGMNIHVLPYAWAYLKCLGDALVLGNVATPVTHISPDIEDSLTTGVSSYYLMGLREVHDFVNIMAKYYSVRYATFASLISCSLSVIDSRKDAYCMTRSPSKNPETFTAPPIFSVAIRPFGANFRCIT